MGRRRFVVQNHECFDKSSVSFIPQIPNLLLCNFAISCEWIAKRLACTCTTTCNYFSGDEDEFANDIIAINVDFSTPTADMMQITYGGERHSLKILDNERKLEEVPIDSEKQVNLPTERASVSKELNPQKFIKENVYTSYFSGSPSKTTQ